LIFIAFYMKIWKNEHFVFMSKSLKFILFIYKNGCPRAWFDNSGLVNLLECLLSSTNCAKILGQNQCDWPIVPKKMKLWRLLKIEGFVLMYIVPPFGPTYIDESAKAYGLKVRCLYMENMLGNTLWTWGTLWKPIRNLKGTLWKHIRKQGKPKKKIFPIPPWLGPSYWLKGK